MRWCFILILALLTTGIFAQEAPVAETVVATPDPAAVKAVSDEVATLRSEINWLWTCIAAFMVFFMQAGFAYVEAGFTRAKNVVNILMKNFIDFCLGSIFFWLLGFSIMFGPQLLPGFGIGMPGLAENLIVKDGVPDKWGFAFFIFQMVFAGTAATIVSGAMAERTKFVSYIIFSVLMTALVYPFFGSLAWAGLWGLGKGFLEQQGFIDFAGSTVVHSVGGWAGLAGALILGPRIGKYQDGKLFPILGHNMSMAALGVFILWFGWFGFNPGSTTSVNGGNFAVIAVTTNMAAVSGALASMIVTWIMFKKPDIGLSLNGALAGLVAITAPCANVSISSAVIIGFIAGILVVLSVLFFDRIHIDDPVGAVSVHGVCGAWGTLAAGLFAQESYGGVNGLFFGGELSVVLTQLTGIGIAFVWSFGVSSIIFLILKYTLGLRVSEDEEIMGLDILEHGNEAYPISK
ncbi:ammonium transporter [Leptospira yasudae]|uniref:Ammonium transporter n=1 Tax=Leptospira yasudae TaxID=2202201 RepID=A0ABX9M5U1_9LEPT|nr:MULTISPECIES: ammonium transporter [Leptospira]MCG6167029.1 ammonium transporter [Leptospira sanjuanensis]MCG6192484.1 ammonium transporter [Leptospira sanjuanensis]RHX80914.1 ammonium transporter [Leptospira yasudae]RHX94263.1 ammonium transporter [Leptospira yasudae]TGK24020.1 ammonium transporter [Leptospira yasudae]